MLGGVAPRLRAAAVALIVAVTLADVVRSSLLAPLGAAAIEWLVRRSGRYAIANLDLVGFALSLPGVLSILILALAALIGMGLTRGAALFAIEAKVAGRRRPGALSGVVAVLEALRSIGRLVKLALHQAMRLAPIALAAVALIGLVAWFVVGDVELYWVVTTRPPRFWAGLGVIVPIAAVGAALVIRRVLGWSVALPLCLIDGVEPSQALRESELLLRGRLAPLALARVGWWILVSLIGFGIAALVYAVGVQLLLREFSSLTRTAIAAGVVLLAHALVVSITTLVLVAGDVLIVDEAWRQLTRRGRAPDAGEPEAGGAADGLPENAADEGTHAPPPRRRATLLALCGGVAVLAAISGVATRGLLVAAQQPLDVEITAHRGAGRVAPENTLAAFRAAIEQGADRIELDVLGGADGSLLIFHDTDLRRMSGDPRRVATLSLEEMRQVDVGAWFGRGFEGEGVPTLDEVFDLTAGRMPLNIEIKTGAADEGVAEAVVDVVRARGAAGGLVSRGLGADPPDASAVITSLSAAMLESVRRADATIPLGFIVSASIGDLRRLDVDFLSIESGLATSDFLARATAAGLDVHVWSVSDPEHFTRLVLRGIDGAITDDVVALRTRLAELRELDELERLLLGVRMRMTE